MQIQIPEDTSEKIAETSKQLGIKKRDLVDRAILLYLDNISKYVDFQKDMNMWDTLSDEALMNFENKL